MNAKYSMKVVQKKKMFLIFIPLIIGAILVSNFLAAQFLRFGDQPPIDTDGGGDYDPETGNPPYGTIILPPDDSEIGYSDKQYTAPGHRYTYQIPIKLLVHDDTGIDSYVIKWSVKSVEWGILISPALNSYTTIDSFDFNCDDEVYDREIYKTIIISYRYEHQDHSLVNFVLNFDFYIVGSDTQYDAIQSRALELTFEKSDLETYSSNMPPEDNTDPSTTMDVDDYLNDPAGNWDLTGIENLFAAGFDLSILIILITMAIVWRRRKIRSCFGKDEDLNGL